MQARILRLSFAIDDASGDHCRPQEARHDMYMIPQLAFAVGKHQAELTLGAGEVPFPQSVHNERVNRNRAIACLAFGHIDLAEPIRTLANMDFAPFQIDIIPSQATQFRTPHASEYCRDENRTHPSSGSMHNGLNLARRRDIDASL